jgi:CRP-like cAMP-binding protein
LARRSQVHPTARDPALQDPNLSPKWGIAMEGLDAFHRKIVLDRMSSTSRDPQEVLFEQGEPSESLFVITQGRVRLFQTLENGEEFTFGISLPGTILGLAAVVADRPRILSAQALGAVMLSIMKRKDLVDCMSQIPSFHWNISRLLAILSIESIERSGPMALDSAFIRLGNALRSLARPCRDPAEGIEILVVDGITQQELAKMVGASRSSVAVALSEFARLGLIDKRRERIEIRNERGLANFIVQQRNH